MHRTAVPLAALNACRRSMDAAGMLVTVAEGMVPAIATITLDAVCDHVCGSTSRRDMPRQHWRSCGKP